MTAKAFLAAVRSGDVEGATAIFHTLPAEVQPSLRPLLAQARNEGAAMRRFEEEDRLQRRVGSMKPPTRAGGATGHRMG